MIKYNSGVQALQTSIALHKFDTGMILAWFKFIIKHIQINIHLFFILAALAGQVPRQINISDSALSFLRFLAI
ncbi:hypothetical protein AWB61_17470 [Chromobacterium sp. F49]|nr:hypothetical protein Cv017_19775 [Chromobacterium subtsugae]KZE86070.1 hypothetical protein AWB61_17470 [Chromobacterium sp. F49]OBU85036.1 hypothetical protein MY55_18660 [Chromobacterium subtsugae]